MRLEERVGDIIPEFATNGKEQITVEQAFLHIGGFPMAPLGAPAWYTREGRLEAFKKWRLNWEPGTKFEYHATSLHWVLAEIIERRTGMEWRQYVSRHNRTRDDVESETRHLRSTIASSELTAAGADSRSVAAMRR